MSKIEKIILVTNEKNCVAYESVDIENYNGTCGEKALTHSFLMDTLRKIMGRTLTMIDASIPEKQQNKAMKDIIRNIFSDEMEFSSNWAFDQNELEKQAEEYFEGVDDEELEKHSVSVEEALGVEE